LLSSVTPFGRSIACQRPDDVAGRRSLYLTEADREASIPTTCMEAGMYERYWLLTHRPFETCGDTPSCSLAPPQNSLYEKLSYSLLDHAGVALLTGAPGVGKTTLASRIAAAMAQRGGRSGWSTTSVFDAAAIIRHLAAQILPDSQGQTPQSLASPALLQDQLQQHLREQGGRYLFCIDEAHTLSEQSFALLKQLAETSRQNSQWTTRSRLQVSLLLVGHDSLRDVVTDSNCGFDTLAAPFRLNTLRREEVGPYLEACLRTAGGQQTYFDEQAVERLFRESRGVIRLLNRMADLALLAGYVRRRAIVSEDDVCLALRELALPQAA